MMGSQRRECLCSIQLTVGLFDGDHGREKDRSCPKKSRVNVGHAASWFAGRGVMQPCVSVGTV
jgi:hypothetical protein